MKVAVSGSRHATREHYSQIIETLGWVDIHYGIDYIFVGDAPGVDLLVYEWADKANIPVDIYEADWLRYGKGAGTVRNQHMIDSSPDYWVAFPLPGSVGTWDFITKAVRAKIPGQIVAL